jgi:chromosomal replication initiation ATPase DnaA
MTAATVNAWFAPMRALDQDSAVLRVAVPAPFNKAWPDIKLADALHKIDDDALGTGRVSRVEYIVEAAAGTPPEAMARAS